MQSTKAFLVVFLNAIHPGAARQADAPVILDAIVRITEAEKEPVFGSKRADAVVLAGTAWFESRMRLHVDGDHGKAHGAYQLHQWAGQGDALTQTRAALWHLRRDKAACVDLPVAAYLSGNCRHARRQARYRMFVIMAALRRAKLA